MFSPEGAQTSWSGIGALGGSSSTGGGGGSASSNAAGEADGGTEAGGVSGTAGAPVLGGGGGSGGNPGTDPLGGAGVATGGDAANGGSAGSGGSPPTPVETCEGLEGVINDANQHCYRLEADELDFSTARAACQAAGGHLVTVSDQAENEFLHGLHDGEHWLGATDNRPDTMEGAGDYAWVNAEAWSYSAWEDGQPNAKETGCPNERKGACFEHCGFQTAGGGWNDRSCWHTIASVCEWEMDESKP